MQNFLNRILRLRPGETKLVLVMGSVFLSNALAQQVSEITAVSNFLEAAGVTGMLAVWAMDAVIILAMTIGQSFIIDRYSRLDLTRWVLFGLALAFVALRLLFVFQLPAWLNYGLLFLLSEQQWLLTIVFWTLINDLTDLSQATRLVPLIANGEALGKLLGIGVAAVTPWLIARAPNVKVEELLVLNAFVYLLAYALFNAGMRTVKVRPVAVSHETVKDTLTEGWEFITEVPAFRYLTLALLLVLVCDTVLEFRFMLISKEIFADVKMYAAFYSLYRLTVILATLFIQSFLTSRIITAIKLKNAFLIEPLSICVSALVSFWAGLGGALASILTLKISQATLGDATRKAFQNLVPEERRGRVTMFMDSYQFCLGTLIGCGLTGLVIWIGQQFNLPYFFYVYLGLAVVLGLVSLAAGLKVRQHYDASLLNWRLKRRQRGKSVLDKLDF